MKAVTWHGRRDVRVDTVPDPAISQSSDAIVRITSSGICGSDLHLYEVLAPFMNPGDVLGHEPMGVVEEVGSEVSSVSAGDRVVIPFTISCGQCFFCEKEQFSACETTNPKRGFTMNKKELRSGAGLFGFTHLNGDYPGGQAEFVRVPKANVGPLVWGIQK